MSRDETRPFWDQRATPKQIEKMFPEIWDKPEARSISSFKGVNFLRLASENGFKICFDLPLNYVKSMTYTLSESTWRKAPTCTFSSAPSYLQALQMAIADHKKAGHAPQDGNRCVVRVGVMTVPAIVAARCAYV